MNIDADVPCVEIGRETVNGQPLERVIQDVSSGLLTEKLNIVCLGCDRLAKASIY